VSNPDESVVEGGPTDGDETESNDDQEGPAPQSAALRRQQFYVGVGAVVLAGVAVAVILLQRFPDAPTLLPVVGGVFGAGVVFWLVRGSLSPADQPVSGDDAD
jgi:hypothetical protein